MVHAKHLQLIHGKIIITALESFSSLAPDPILQRDSIFHLSEYSS